MSISQNFPEEGPSLNLNFAGSKTLDPRITFTRTSSATYMDDSGLIRVAPANSARFDHRFNPTNGEIESLGLLVEEPRSNFALLSGRPDVDRLLDVSGGNGLDFIDGEIVTSNVGGLSGTYVANASTNTKVVMKYSVGTPAGVLTGSTSGATRNITSFSSVGGGAVNVFNEFTNETLSPSGAYNAFLMSPSTTGTQLRTTSKTYTTSTAGTYTYSIFFKNKNISNNRVAIYIGNQTALSNVVANFDTSTKTFLGAVGQNGGWTGSVGYQDYPNGWIRIWVTATTTAGSHTFLSGSLWLGGYQGTTETIGSMYVWESQLEAGAFPTSQIQTTYSSVTRTADNASMTGSNFSSWYNSNESTFFTSFRPAYNASATVPARTPHVLQAGNATTVNDNYTIRGAESNLYWTVLIRSASPSSLQFPGFNPYPYLNSSTQYKAALSVNRSLISVSLNGLLSADSVNTTTVNHTTPFNKLFIGSGTGGGPPYELTGHIAQITYYPVRLTNSQLQTLTR
jgi:hypothetical protein